MTGARDRRSSPLGCDLRIDGAHHHGLDRGQELGCGAPVDAERLGHGKRCGHVEPDDGTGHCPQLAGQALRQIPDQPALERMRAVQDGRALPAGGAAAAAIVLPAAEVPLGKGGEAFFSSSSSRPFVT